MAEPVSKEGKLAAARLRLRKKFPPMAALVQGMGYGEDQRLPVPMCSTASGGIVYNTLRWQRETVLTLMFRIARECTRMASKHVDLAGKLADEYGERFDPQLFAECSDISINPSLLEAGLTLGTTPSGRTRALLPADFGMQDGQTAEQYYRKLHDSHSEAAEAGVEGCVGGSGAGCGHGLHQGEDEEFGPGVVAVMGVVKLWADECKASGQFGLLPGCLRIAVDTLTAEPVIDWTEEFRKIMGDTAQRCAGSGHMAFHMRNTRLQPAVDRAHIGRPYCPVVPGKDNRKPSLIVAIDVSGSVMGCLARFFAQAAEIIDAYAGPVEFVTVDTRLRHFPKVRDIETLKASVVGGGGTDFRPVFDYVENKHPTQRPKVMVFMTDGDGYAPKDQPRGLEVVWLLTPGGRRPLVKGEAARLEWGQAVNIK